MENSNALTMHWLKWVDDQLQLDITFQLYGIIENYKIERNWWKIMLVGD